MSTYHRLTLRGLYTPSSFAGQMVAKAKVGGGRPRAWYTRSSGVSSWSMPGARLDTSLWVLGIHGALVEVLGKTVEAAARPASYEAVHDFNVLAISASRDALQHVCVASVPLRFTSVAPCAKCGANVRVLCWRGEKVGDERRCRLVWKHRQSGL